MKASAGRTSLAEPASLTPRGHVYVAEQLPWVHLADDLPRYAGTSVGSTAKKS